MFTRKMFTRKNAVVLVVAMTCLLPVVSSADDDDRERHGDKDVQCPGRAASLLPG